MSIVWKNFGNVTNLGFVIFHRFTRFRLWRNPKFTKSKICLPVDNNSRTNDCKEIGLIVKHEK